MRVASDEVSDPDEPLRIVAVFPEGGGELRGALGGLGATLALVRDAEACRAACRSGPVDLVLLDASAVGGCEELLAQLADAGPPLLAAGRSLAPALRARLLRAGAAACIDLAGGEGGAAREALLRELARGGGARGGPPELELQREKMASIGQLAAGVAHEINNPMGFIHANLFQMAEYVRDLRQVWSQVDALQKAVGQGELAEIRRAAEALAAAAREVDVDFVLSDLGKAIRESQEGSERIRHIVQDLRDFSHCDTGERVLADVNQCLDSTANIVWPMMKHLVALEREYSDLPALYCFPMQLKQVFMNLLVNAYQSIEQRLGQSGRTGQIGLRTRVGEGGVQVSVRDSGVGIPPEHLERIFDPFYTTKEVGAGTGLGLSTSYTIVQRHGGAIWAESRPGEGSIFHIFLPGEPPDEEPDGG